MNILPNRCAATWWTGFHARDAIRTFSISGIDYLVLGRTRRPAASSSKARKDSHG